MAYVKSISVHKSVGNAIKYILNENKTDNGLLVSGINVSTDNEIATMQFKHTYNNYIGKYESENKKQVVAHHFVQSFKEGEVTPEVAHNIGLESVKKHFGENAQVLISTHIDKGHIHNHILVNGVDINAKKYHANKKSLWEFRYKTNDVCKENGLSVIESREVGKGKKYNVWQDKMRGYSWRDKAKIAIDIALVNSNSIEDAIEEIKNQGYDCEIKELKSGKKYLAIKQPKFKYFASAEKFGAGYSFDELINRIDNKDVEFEKLRISIEQIKYKVKVGKSNNGVKIKPYTRNKFNKKQYILRKLMNKYYKISLGDVIVKAINKLFKAIDNREMQTYKRFDKTKPYSKENDYYVQTLAGYLKFISDNKISSKEDLVYKIERDEKVLDECQNKINELTKQKEKIKTVNKAIDTIKYYESKRSLSCDERKVLELSKGVVQKAYDTGVDISSDGVMNLDNEIIRLRKDIEASAKRIKCGGDVLGWLDGKDSSDLVSKWKNNSR